MIISRRKSFIFAAVGKTGTTTLESVLRCFEDTFPDLVYKKHAPFGEIEEQVDLGEFYKFMFFRNPWDLVLSKYCFHRRARGAGYGGIAVNEGARNLPFHEWVRVPEFLYAQYEYPIKTMYDFGVSRRDGRFLADRVYQFEDMENAFAHICEALSLPRSRLPVAVCRHIARVPMKLPVLNRSRHAHYRRYYDQETKEIVERFFAREINMMNYEF
jgi:hypothetical protein